MVRSPRPSRYRKIPASQLRRLANASGVSPAFGRACLRCGIWLLTVAVLGACHKEEKPKDEGNWAYFPARRALIEDKRTWSGVVRAANRIEIRAEKKVKIGKLMVKNQQQVRAKQLMIQVDRAELEKKVTELNDRLAAAAVDQASAAINLESARRVAARKNGLAAKGIIALKESEDTEKQAQLAGTTYQSKELELEKAKRDLAETKAQSSTADFYAPMAGQVSQVFELSGTGFDEVQPGQVLAVVSDPRTLALYCDVDEADANLMKVGAKASITFEALPGRTTAAEVTEIGANPGGTGGKYHLTFHARAFPAGVKEGFSGDATVVFASKADAVVVPLGSLRFVESKEYVLAAAKVGGEPQPKPVKTGIRSLLEVEITEGVRAGDIVAGDAE